MRSKGSDAEREAEESEPKPMKTEDQEGGNSLGAETWAGAKWIKVGDDVYGRGCKTALNVDKPAKRWAHSATTIGRMMYVYGGCGKDNLDFKEVMQFSYASCEWTVLKDDNRSPPPRDSHVAFGWDGRLYVFGGSTANKRLNDLWEFDVPRKTWREVKVEGKVPVEREAHAAVAVPESAVLVFGGRGPGEKLADAQVLTITSSAMPTLSWTNALQQGDLPSPRDGHCMCGISKDIYLFGGEDNEKQMLNDLYVGSLAESCTVVWKKCPQKNPPLPRRAASLSSYMENYLVLIGGEAYGEGSTCTLNDVWVYSVSTGMWEEIGSGMRTGNNEEFTSRAYYGAAAFENCVYIFGGINQDGKILGDFWVLCLHGDVPKPLEAMQTSIPSIISGRDGRTLMTSTRKVQYFTQYMQDIPFPVENKVMEGGSKEAQEDEEKAILGVSPKYLLESCDDNEWPIGSFGDLLNVLEDLTANSEFKIKVLLPPKRVSITLEEEKDLEDKSTVTEHDALTRYTRQMRKELKLQDKARMQPAIEVLAEGVSVSADNFRDILYFFGKRTSQKTPADFGLLKQSLMKIGKGVLVINKIGGSANVGLISSEYMDLLHTDSFYCPYVRLAMEGGKLTADSSSLTLLEKMVKYSYAPFENKDKLLSYIQRMDDSVVFIIAMISKLLKYKYVYKEEDIEYQRKEADIQDYELLDYSLRVYLRYWNLWNKSRVTLEETDAALENPYVVLRRYVESRKITKWVKAINFSFKKVDCVGFIFHINLFSMPEMKTFEKHCEIFNGVLVYWQNKLLLRVLGPRLGDHVELARKVSRKKAKHGKTHKLFKWNGYVSVTKGMKEDVNSPLFLCGLEEVLINIMQ